MPALIGCGPKFTGSIPGREGDGTPPVPATGQAQVTSLSPSTVAAQSAAFTLTVNGKNFLPSTLVMWDFNTQLATTYISSTVLQAQIPASLIAKPGSVSIAPSPLGSLNFGSTLTISAPVLSGNNSFSVITVPVQAHDMAWDPGSQQIYLSIASGNGTAPNSITALNPQTGTLGMSVSTGTEPHKLAISSDSTFAYVGLDGAGSVHRYRLPDLQSDIDIPLGSGGYGTYYAIDLAVQPGNPHALAVTRGNENMSPREQGGVLIYDDSVARPQSVAGGGSSPGPIDALVWNSDGQSLYGLDTETSLNRAYLMSVTSLGVQLQKQSSDSGSLGRRLHFDATTNYIYSDSGNVIDPATGGVVASFPLNSVQGGFNGTSIMVPDGRLNIAYFFGQTADNQTLNAYVLAAFDLTHHNLLGAVQVGSVLRTPLKILRWGTSGLAVLTGADYGSGVPDAGVYILSGAFVTSPAP
ncbi:MAG TPA: hypothetical protein VFS41_09570 [Edaphobacter sp.]|nr:hypothetical protein [Edaphobacter sp.]